MVRKWCLISNAEYVCPIQQLATGRIEKHPVSKQSWLSCQECGIRQTGQEYSLIENLWSEKALKKAHMLSKIIILGFFLSQKQTSNKDIAFVFIKMKTNDNKRINNNRFSCSGFDFIALESLCRHLQNTKEKKKKMSWGQVCPCSKLKQKNI